ncbi:hypothetical protein HGRIS_004137 [Hohenbuehelia grisea]|uniref:DhaK domain-containing protein n=1 Tax=Hohenbuehelia grisea TaxID=104357 RepID=A0ABR3JIS9_9AGAR
MDQHLTNDPKDLVLDSLKGLCTLNPNIALDEANKVVYLAQRDPTNVSLICGGGAGHEPAWAGYVGPGMLTAAVCGNVFASPNASQVRQAIDLVHNDKGTLIIVKNYTGDILNFGLAREQYAARHPEAAAKNLIRFVIVGDDVAVPEEQGGIVGRRGLAGTVLVAKLAGALAARGASLDEVHALAQYVASSVSTVGVGLGHCHVPGTAAAEASSAKGLEIGLGIHNEPGVERISPVPPVRDLVRRVARMVVAGRASQPKHESGEEVVLLVNNLGGMSELEMGGIAGEVANAFSVGYDGAELALEDTRGIKVSRLISGTFMTSLNMPGFSLTLLRLSQPPTPTDNSQQPQKYDSEMLLDLLDHPVVVPGWNWDVLQPPSASRNRGTHSANQDDSAEQQPSVGAKLAASDPDGFVNAVRAACEALIVAEPELTRYDAIAGDGDCGLTLKVGSFFCCATHSAYMSPFSSIDRLAQRVS